MHGASDPPLQFPPLPLSIDDGWQWPCLPFPWGDWARQAEVAMQPCRIETSDGMNVDVTLVDIDPARGVLTYAGEAHGLTVSLPFARLRRLTLTSPLPVAETSAGAPRDAIPAPSEERSYELGSTDGDLPPLTGRTLGHLLLDEGLYLFEPVDEPRALLRVFVPRTAYSSCTFGRSIQEKAAELWIADPTRLLEVIDRPPLAVVPLIGQSLLELGLLSPRQLERALAEKPAGVALGDMLVSEGLISLAELWTGLAHKMGYPLVDLSHFPIDLPISMWSTVRLSLKLGALPILVDGRRLVVAVDRPANAITLRNLGAASQKKVVPVFARQFQILAALGRLSRLDVWSELVPTSMEFVQTPT